jgi:hypothetical protein
MARAGHYDNCTCPIHRYRRFIALLFTFNLEGVWTAEEAATISREDVVRIIHSYTNMLADLLIEELDNILKTMDTKDVPVKLFPYLAALSTIGFCGKDNDDEIFVNLLKSVDIRPDKEIMAKVLSLRIHNFLIYVHILYFLLDVGKPPTVENMLSSAKSLGFPPDMKLATFVLDQYMKKQA